MTPLRQGKSSLRLRLHYAATNIAIRLGPTNSLLLLFIRRQCRRFGCELRLKGGKLELQKDKRMMTFALEHFVYAPTLAFRFDLFFNSLVPSRRDDLSVLDLSHAQVHTYRASGLQFELSGFPEEEEAFTAYVSWYKPQPGDLVFDVGAHCGVSAYHFSRLVGPTGRVIAFEPDPRNFPVLLRNIERHGLRNVIPVQTAITGRSGKTSFFSEGALGSCVAHTSSRATPGREVSVDAMSLNDAFGRWGVPQLCKLDIEGSEVEVLEGSKELIRQVPTNFVLDTSHLVNGERSFRAVEDVFKDCGFEVESEECGEMTTWARPRLQSALIEYEPAAALAHG